MVSQLKAPRCQHFSSKWDDDTVTSAQPRPSQRTEAVTSLPRGLLRGQQEKPAAAGLEVGAQDSLGGPRSLRAGGG